MALLLAPVPHPADAQGNSETPPQETPAADESAPGGCALPLPRDRIWRPQEKWAWEERLCLGLFADMRVYFRTKLNRQLSCNPGDASAWPPEASLSGRFLEAIIRSPGYVSVLNDKDIEIAGYQDLLPDKGIQIVCAQFRDVVDLDNAKLGKPMSIGYSRFENIVSLQRLQSSSVLYLFQNVFEKGLQGYALSVADDLAIQNNNIFRGPVSLISARVGGNFIINKSAFIGPLSVENISVGGSFRIQEESQIATIDLRRARIGNVLQVSNSKFLGKFDADGIDVGGFAQFRNKASFDAVSMVSARVRGSMDTIGAIFNKLVYAYGLQVDGSLFLRGGATFHDLNLSNSVIGGSLELRGSTFNGRVDLTNASITHELQVASPLPKEEQTEERQYYDPPRWGDRAELILRNTRAEALQDTVEAWDNLDGRLDLVGFTYQHLGGLRSTRDDILAARSIDWILGWLGKQKDRADVYQPQPYEQLAKVLRASGWIDKADDVLIARNDYQLLHPTTPWATKAWMAVKWALIGYGLEVWLSIVWLFGLQAVGTLVMVASPIGREIGWLRSAFYSIDTSVPFVELNPLVHNELSEQSPQKLKYYFALHRILGLILVTFLAAGMSGLTNTQ